MASMPPSALSRGSGGEGNGSPGPASGPRIPKLPWSCFGHVACDGAGAGMACWVLVCGGSCSFHVSDLPLPPPKLTSLSHNALPRAPSRLRSKSFSKIQGREAPGGARSSLLARADHHPRDEVDDGGRRLVGVQLSKEVAHVVRGAALFPGHEAKEPGGEMVGINGERQMGAGGQEKPNPGLPLAAEMSQRDWDAASRQWVSKPPRLSHSPWIQRVLGSSQ